MFFFILQESEFAYDVFGTTEFGNEIYLLNGIRRFQNTVNRVSSEGFKELKTPTWWTLFEEGTLKSFVTEYKKKVYIFIDSLINSCLL